MDWARCRKLMWRWSLVTAALITAFWHIWAIFAPVPAVYSITINMDYSCQLPFPISRWWDVLFGPIYSALFIWIWYRLMQLKKNRNELASAVILQLMMAVGVGLGFGLIPGTIAFKIAPGLTFGLAFSLLTFMLICLPALALFWGSTYILAKVTSRNFWTAVRNWLMVKN